MACASPVEIRKELGATVRAHRLRLGFSQERLAEKASLHRTYVTDVERGARNISLESISRLAQALEVSISSLFIGSNAIAGLPDGTPRTGAAASILLVDDDREDVRLALTAFR